ncbi:MAG TPA: VOC family protein [Myxococcota bacterium]|nr:VOC family protein [Myxococcota bacterium]
MANNVVHFQILADDLARCRRFYERVFGWQFRPWGPPDFYMIQTGPGAEPGIHGSLAKRHHPLAESGGFGFECTISVADVDAIAHAVEANGGKLVYQKTEIPTVGELIQFQDTEGNTVSAMRYFAE